MGPTAAQLSRRTSARSSRFPKSVASFIAMSDGRPDPAQSVRHDRACPRVRLLAAPPPKGPPSLGWRPDGPALLASPPVTVSPKRSLACRESIGPSSTELDEVLAKDRICWMLHGAGNSLDRSKTASETLNDVLGCLSRDHVLIGATKTRSPSGSRRYRCLR